MSATLFQVESPPVLHDVGLLCRWGVAATCSGASSVSGCTEDRPGPHRHRDSDFVADQSSFARKARTLADHAAPLMTEAGLRCVVCCLHLHEEGTYGDPGNDTKPSRCIVRLTQHGYYSV